MAAERTASCPRCGYDLRAHRMEWTDRCPLRGRCSECGLDLEWRLVFAPRPELPRWSVEGTPLSRFGLAAISTASRSIWPPGLWRSIRMEHPIRTYRLLGYVVMLALVPIVVRLLEIVLVQSWRSAAVVGMPAMKLAVLDVYGRAPFYSFGLAVLLVALLPVGILACTPISMRRARLRSGHVWRIAAYGSFIALAALAPGVLRWNASLLDVGGAVSRLIVTSNIIRLVLPLALPPALLAIWWSVACRRYLKLPHPWLVGTSVTALCTLVVAAANWSLTARIVVTLLP